MNQIEVPKNIEIRRDFEEEKQNPKYTYYKLYLNSDHNLSYHYDQIHSLAISGEENEPYLKTLGRPVNTCRIANSNGQVKANSPVGKVKVAKTKDFPNVNIYYCSDRL